MKLQSIPSLEFAVNSLYADGGRSTLQIALDGLSGLGSCIFIKSGRCKLKAISE